VGATAQAGKKSPTKSQIISELADGNGLTKKQVQDVLDGLDKLIKREVGKKGSGSFTLPGLAKFVRKEKPATKAKMGRNPATGEPIEIKAKPKSTVVRIRPLKPLKEAVS